MRASRFLTAYYMRTYGATREDFGKLCVAQRTNALKNPLALFKKPLTLDEYLDARLIADPLRLFDCVMPCAGAEGFLVMRRGDRREPGPALRAAAWRDRAAQRLSRRPGAVPRRLGAWTATISTRRPASGPDDIDFFQTYDDYPVINVLQFEDLGFCGKGEGAGFRPRQHVSRRTAAFRSTPRAANCRSARPARPADISA